MAGSSIDYQVINNCGEVDIKVTYKKNNVSGDQTVTVTPHPSGEGAPGTTETVWRKHLIDVETGTTVKIEQLSAQEGGTSATLTLPKVATPITIEFEHTTAGSGSNTTVETGDDE